MQDFETIYGRYFQPVYRYLLSLCRDGALAEELTQAAFFAALKTIGSFREGCAVESWLIGIARNLYFDHCRKQRRWAGEPAEQAAGTAEEPPDTLLDRAETAGLFQRLLHALPEPYKEVFMLRVYGELSFAGIAGLFQKTESWARVTYYRAKQKLQAQIREENNHG